MHVRMHACVHVCVCTCMHVRVCVCTETSCKGMYRNVAELVNVCILFFIFIWYNQQKCSLKYPVIVNNPISIQIFKA